MGFAFGLAKGLQGHFEADPVGFISGGGADILEPCSFVENFDQGGGFALDCGVEGDAQFAALLVVPFAELISLF